VKLLCTLLLFAFPSFSQQDRQTISVSGDAEIKVVPDQVLISLGVETRARTLTAARQGNDGNVRTVLDAIRKAGVALSDIQTHFINVSLHYNRDTETLVDYYSVEKSIAVTVRDVSAFETLLSAVLDAGANHIYGVEFMTTQLRRHRDEARKLAIKAAMEKANDLAAAAGLTVVQKPVGIASYSFGGGSSYGRWRGRAGMYQNVSQNIIQTGGGAAPEGTVALGKISVTASVTMTFRLE
jgi:uncharacterized protein YggE